MKKKRFILNYHNKKGDEINIERDTKNEIQKHLFIERDEIDLEEGVTIYDTETKDFID